MIALDTNVLVRVVVEDDPRQVERVRALFAKARAEGEACLLTDPVLCELEWVLTAAYGASRSEVLQALQAVATDELFIFENRELVLRAIDRYEQGAADLSDYLIGLRGEEAGATTTYTFDKALRAEQGFSAP